MKNKKGFTLIEIIVCIALIAGISTITIVSLKSSKSKEDKIITTVKNAADVYYSSNDNIKKELENNYGFLLVKIDELKNKGMLDNKLETLNSTSDEKYDSVLIYDMDKVNKLVKLDEYETDNIGYIDYQYPYYEKTFIPYLEDLDLENVPFKCHETGLFRDNELVYLENYEKKYTTNFNCYLIKEDESQELIDEISDVGSYTISYKINDGVYRYRKVNIYSNFDYKLIAKSGTEILENYCVNPTWTNKDITLSVSTDDNIEEHKSYHLNNSTYTWYNDNVLDETSKGKIEKKFTTTTNAKVKTKYNKLDDKEQELSCQLNIDKVPPTIETLSFNSTNNKLKVKFKDEGGSELKEYCIGTDDNNCSILESTGISGNEKTVEIKINPENNNVIRVWDKADNETHIEYNTRDIPQIDIENKNNVTIESTTGGNLISPGIELKINSFSENIRDVKIKYTINDKYEFNEEYCNDGSCNQNYEIKYNMHNLLEKCQGDFECHKEIGGDVNSLSNFNVKYEVEVSNGIKRSIKKFNAKLDIRKINLEELGKDNDNKISVRGINDMGDIIFTNSNLTHTSNTTGSVSTSHSSKGILHYSGDKEEMSIVGTYGSSGSTWAGNCSRSSSFEIYNWNENSIEYSGCDYTGSGNCSSGINRIRGGIYDFNTKTLNSHSRSFNSSSDNACRYSTGTGITITDKFENVSISSFYTPINSTLGIFNKLSKSFSRKEYYKFTIKKEILSKLTYSENNGTRKYFMLLQQYHRQSKSYSYKGLIFNENLIKIENLESTDKDA